MLPVLPALSAVNHFTLTYLLSLSNTGVSACVPLAAERHEGYDTEAFISVPFNLHNCHVPSVPSVLLWVLEMFLKVTTSQCTLIIVMSCS